MADPAEITGQNINRDTAQHDKNHGDKTPVAVRAPPIGTADLAYFRFRIMGAVVFIMVLWHGVFLFLGEPASVLRRRPGVNRAGRERWSARRLYQFFVRFYPIGQRIVRGASAKLPLEISGYLYVLIRHKTFPRYFPVAFFGHMLPPFNFKARSLFPREEREAQRPLPPKNSFIKFFRHSGGQRSQSCRSSFQRCLARQLLS